jgi:hypothetical protein
LATADSIAIFYLMSDATSVPEKSQPKPAVPRPAEEARPHEIGGPKGPEPTRYGDWEKDGRCTDF